MSDLKTMSFELNQTQLDAAIAAAMPSLVAGLAIKYTSGRPPKGVTADVTLSESLIRDAVIDHTRKLVNPSFTHFSISFRATRGEDGLTTTVTASSEEIAPEEPNDATQEALSAAEAGDVTRVESPAALIEELNKPEAVTEQPVAEPQPAQEAVEEAVQEANDAPFEADTAATQADEALAPVEAVEAPAEAAVAEEVTTADVKPVEEAAKPAGRSRLFADLTRPNNAE